MIVRRVEDEAGLPVLIVSDVTLGFAVVDENGDVYHDSRPDEATRLAMAEERAAARRIEDRIAEGLATVPIPDGMRVDLRGQLLDVLLDAIDGIDRDIELARLRQARDREARLQRIVERDEEARARALLQAENESLRAEVARLSKRVP